MTNWWKTCLAVIFCASPLMAIAEGAQIAFGNTAQDSSQPVEVTADSLDVNQTNGTAIFTGNVVVGQGQMRLSAPRVLVVYLEDQSGIERLQASGGVTLVSGEDAAESANADYNITSGKITMQGNVLLIQGANALTADNMLVDTKSGTARMTGRVKTVLRPQE